MSTPTDLKGTDASLSLLKRLVDDAMDPGYRTAKSRPANKAAGWRDSAAVALMICLLALLVVAAILQVRAGAPSDGRTRADLLERVQTATATLTDQENEVNSLANAVDVAQQAALAGSQSDRALADEAAAFESRVGGAELTGPGLEVTLQDGPPAPVEEGGPDLARVLDTDIQLVVNGLFAAGAQGVSVNGQRVTVLSPIRSAGEAVLVGFRPLTPPYVVTAVGPESLASSFESSPARAELAGLEASYGIGVDVNGDGQFTVPARADLQVRYAEGPNGPAADKDGSP